MRGRKPTPTALKIARGNPGHRPIAADEPQPSTDIDLAVPDILVDDADARGEWETKAPMLHRLGIFTEADRDALTLYCATFSRWKQAERQLRKSGMIVLAGQNKYPIINPFLTISTKAQTQCRAMLEQFGLTPSSRGRVHAAKKEIPDAQRERFFGGNVAPFTPKPKRR